jgi:hypothetical protein
LRTGSECDDPDEGAAGALVPALRSFIDEELGERPPLQRVVAVPDLLVLKRFSRVERVTGIEPALSAWEEFLSHRLSVSCNDIGGLS